MPFLQLTGGAAFALLTLPGWERERVCDALVLLTTDPRPPYAAALQSAGEAFEVWVGERRVQYRVYKDDDREDRVVVVFAII